MASLWTRRRHRWSLLVALEVLSAVVPLVVGSGEAMCSYANYSWALNSYNQSPCEVASLLEGSLFAQPNFTLPDIWGEDAWDYYGGPNSTAVAENTDVCSSPLYYVLSACADCQQQNDFNSWSDWKQYCTRVTTGSFPTEYLPDNTTIPTWALIVPVTTYNRTQAELIAESAAATATQNTTIASSTSSTVVVSSTANATETASSNNTSHSSNSLAGGAIAGIVVGIIAVLSALAAAVLIFRRRQRARRTAPSAAYIAEFGCPNHSPPNSGKDEKHRTISPLSQQSTTPTFPNSIASPILPAYSVLDRDNNGYGRAFSTENEKERWAPQDVSTSANLGTTLIAHEQSADSPLRESFNGSPFSFTSGSRLYEMNSEDGHNSNSEFPSQAEIQSWRRPRRHL